MPERVRIGILGAARHVPTSILQPIRKNSDLAQLVEIVGVASRDRTEAEAFVKKWGLPKAYGSLEELLADDKVDAVYNVLPNAVRCQVSVQALRSGKHVLSESPLCSNAREAVAMQRAAEDSGKVMMEGSHPTCHPLTRRLREMIVEGKVGKIEKIDVTLPVLMSLYGSDICGKVGALLGVGTYCIGLVRALSGEEVKVVSASAKRSKENPEVDSAMSAALALPSGGSAHFSCSIATTDATAAPAEVMVCGSNGIIRAKEWFRGKGQTSNSIELELFDGCGEQSVENLDTPKAATRDTFYYQLMIFAEEVRAAQIKGSHGLPWDYVASRATPGDAVMNMALIDAVYIAAGMSPRPTLNAPAAPYDCIGASKL